MKRILMLLMVAAVVCTHAFAVDRPTAVIEQERALVVRMVDEAIDLITENGLEESVPELNDPAGAFREGDIYIAVMTFDGVMVANPGAPFLAGRQLPLNSTDAKGNPLRMIDIAQDEGEGWFDYYWNHEVKKQVLLKSSYVKRIPGLDAYVSCALWLED